MNFEDESPNPVLDEAYLQALGGPTKRRNSEGSEYSVGSHFSHFSNPPEVSRGGEAHSDIVSLSVAKSVSTLLRSVSFRPHPQPKLGVAADDDDLEKLAEELRKKSSGCKKTWCARNVFREMPIIGGLFALRTSKSAALSAMARDVCGLAAGGAAMVLMPVVPEESQQEKIAKLALAVTTGTVAGRVAYNMAGSVCNGMTMLYNCCLKRATERQRRQEASEDGALTAVLRK